MKYTRICMLTALLLLSATGAFAERHYLTGSIGPNFRTDAKTLLSGSGVSGTAGADMESDVGFHVGAAFGTYLKKFRVEGEIYYRENSLDPVSTTILPAGSDMSMLTFMGNVYHDFKPVHGLNPYVGGGFGLGLASMDNNANGNDDSDLVFSYQLLAGISKVLSNSVTVFLGYRYVNTTDPEFNLSGLRVDTEFSSHELMFGGRFNF